MFSCYFFLWKLCLSYQVIILTFYINQSLAELHDLLIQSYGEEYYVKNVSFQTVGQQEAYDLDTVVTDQDFYKLRGIDAQLNGDDWFTLQQFNFNERNRFQLHTCRNWCRLLKKLPFFSWDRPCKNACFRPKNHVPTFFRVLAMKNEFYAEFHS